MYHLAKGLYLLATSKEGMRTMSSPLYPSATVNPPFVALLLTIIRSPSQSIR